MALPHKNEAMKVCTPLHKYIIFKPRCFSRFGGQLPFWLKMKKPARFIEMVVCQVSAIQFNAVIMNEIAPNFLYPWVGNWRLRTQVRLEQKNDIRVLV